MPSAPAAEATIAGISRRSISIRTATDSPFQPTFFRSAGPASGASFFAPAYNYSMADPPVNPLAYANRSSEARWVTLGKFRPLEAQLAQAKLQSEGIPCNLANQNSAAMYADILGIDVRLEVLTDDVDRARANLDQVRAARAKDAEPYLDEDWRCARCRGRDVKYAPLGIPM